MPERNESMTSESFAVVVLEQAKAHDLRAIGLIASMNQFQAEVESVAEWFRAIERSKDAFFGYGRAPTILVQIPFGEDAE